jgi:CBS domain-containing protein
MNTKAVTVTKDKTLKDAAILMEENKIGSVVIIDNNNVPLGMVTRSDVLKEYVAGGDQINTNIQLDKFVSKELVTVKPNDSLDTISEIMNKTKYHHVIVIDLQTKKLLGIVSTMDVIKMQNRIAKAFPYFIKN